MISPSAALLVAALRADRARFVRAAGLQPGAGYTINPMDTMRDGLTINVEAGHCRAFSSRASSGNSLVNWSFLD